MIFIEAIAKYGLLILIHRGVLYRTRWPRGLRSGSAAARLLGLQVRIPSGAWMSVSFQGLCEVPIPRPEESYRVRVCVSLNVIRCNNNPLHLQ
jgi:hypothetical protein